VRTARQDIARQAAADRRPPESDLPPDRDEGLPSESTREHPVPRRTPPSAPAAVRYHSTGRLLIAGPRSRVQRAAALLRDRLPQMILLVSPEEMPPDESDPGTAPVYEGIAVGVEGHLGAFDVRVAESGGEDPRRRLQCDLMLDLGDPPAFDGEVAPPGYYAPGGDAGLLDTAMTELANLVGTFEKPVYAVLDPDRCAYDRNGCRGCRRCLSLCSSRAIVAENGRLHIDPHRCQGGGICATGCPAGAIAYRHPNPSELLVLLRLKIDAAIDAGIRPPVIFFQDRATPESLRSRADSLANRIVPIEVEEVGAVGMEVWLNALVYGAGAVLLAVGPATPASTVQELSAQQVTAGLLIKALGYEGVRIAVLGRQVDDLPEPLPGRMLPEKSALAELHPFSDKRTLIAQALDILHRYSPTPRKSVDLPVGAPFGTVILDRERCTLCGVCADICPTAALEAGADAPKLCFTEARCVQCGLCRRVCPEGAIGVFPRYVYDRRQREAPRVLKTEAPLRCLACGEAFAAPGLIHKLEDRLAGHWMYADEASRRRLKMCHACRVADLMHNSEEK